MTRRSSSFATTAPVSIRNMPRNCSACSNACTVRPNLRERALGWPMSNASSVGTAAGHGPKAWWTAARHFTFQSQTKAEASMDSEMININPRYRLLRTNGAPAMNRAAAAIPNRPVQLDALSALHESDAPTALHGGPHVGSFSPCFLMRKTNVLGLILSV